MDFFFIGTTTMESWIGWSTREFTAFQYLWCGRNPQRASSASGESVIPASLANHPIIAGRLSHDS